MAQRNNYLHHRLHIDEHKEGRHRMQRFGYAKCGLEKIWCMTEKPED